MLSKALESFENDDINKLQKVFSKDKKLDKTNKNANTIVAELIKKKPDEIHNHLNLLTIIRRLERVGDQTKNIGEEIIFYVEAKVLRHSKQKNIS
jgi:phosphate transport system protein